MKRALSVALAIFVAALFTGGSAEASGMGHGKGIAKVKMSPLPGIKAKEGGEADFSLSKDGESLHYVLRGKNLTDVTMGHVHEVADDGTPGAILAWLYPTTGEAPSLKEGKTSGVLAEGDIAAGKLGGPLKGGTARDLFEKIEQGKAGVAIHTKGNPGGELWGFHKVKPHAERATKSRHAKKAM